MGPNVKALFAYAANLEATMGVSSSSLSESMSSDFTPASANFLEWLAKDARALAIFRRVAARSSSVSTSPASSLAVALASEAIEATLEVEVLRFWILAGGPSLLQAPRPRFDPPVSLLVAGFDPQASLLAVGFDPLASLLAAGFWVEVHAGFWVNGGSR